jgi:hypothetical protein
MHPRHNNEEDMMPYGPKAAVGGTGLLAATGFAVAGWVVGAITLILLGIALLQLARPAPSQRP